MKILIISDSHMFNEYLNSVIKIYRDQVDLMIHCGDSSLEINDLKIQNFDIVVKGNHDDADYPIYRIYQNIFVTHGHQFHIYGGYDELIQICQKHKCQICLHGHTHVPTVQKHKGILFINPGSLMMNRGSYAYGTYAILEIEDQHIQVQFFHHENHQACPSTILEEGLELLEEFKEYEKSKIS